MTRHTGLRLAAAAAAALVLVVATWLAWKSGQLERLTDREQLEALAAEAGLLGPVLLMALLALAIVASPIPSAPIAMVAGAVYGPVAGTLITIAGSCIGAATAFAIARLLAYDALRRWEPVRQPLAWLEQGHSQTWLMVAVLLTRLAPFLSFDAISYAAALSPLAFWRFALATLLGVAPISFALAYGGDMLTTMSANPLLTLLVFGGITGIPIAARLAWIHLRGGR